MPSAVHNLLRLLARGGAESQDRRMSPEARAALPTVLHRQELLASGVTEDEIRTARRTGAWTNLHRGAYCASDSMPSEKEPLHRLRALAIASRSPHLVLSHVSAAAMHHLPIWGTDLSVVHLTRLGPSGGRSGPGRRVHATELRPEEITVQGGARLTSAVRTLIDVGCTAGFATTLIAADAALHRELVRPQALAASLSRTRHRRGAAEARRALIFADGRSESVGESLTRIVMHRSGLPEPRVQLKIYAPGGMFIGRIDLGYPEFGVLIEFDGLIKYSKLLKPGDRAPDVVVAEKLREDRLRDLGYLIVRLVWSELADPATVARKISTKLELGRRIVAAGGISGTWTVEPEVRIPRCSA